MKTLGIIGSVGPESIIVYSRLMIASHRVQKPDGSCPALVINSIDIKKILNACSANKLVKATA